MLYNPNCITAILKPHLYLNLPLLCFALQLYSCKLIFNACCVELKCNEALLLYKSKTLPFIINIACLKKFEIKLELNKGYQKMEGFRELHNNTVPKIMIPKIIPPLNITPLTHVSDGLHIECPPRDHNKMLSWFNWHSSRVLNQFLLSVMCFDSLISAYQMFEFPRAIITCETTMKAQQSLSSVLIIDVFSSTRLAALVCILVFELCLTGSRHLFDQCPFLQQSKHFVLVFNSLTYSSSHSLCWVLVNFLVPDDDAEPWKREFMVKKDVSSEVDSSPHIFKTSSCQNRREDRFSMVCLLLSTFAQANIMLL
jgi:hypothetical protein